DRRATGQTVFGGAGSRGRGDRARCTPYGRRAALAGDRAAPPPRPGGRGTAGGTGRPARGAHRTDQPLNRGKAPRPAYLAASSSSSSMRISWLYLATRSERAGAPVLIWPQLIATEMSAMVVSSVSPERCEVMVV